MAAPTTEPVPKPHKIPLQRLNTAMLPSPARQVAVAFCDLSSSSL